MKQKSKQPQFSLMQAFSRCPLMWFASWHLLTLWNNRQYDLLGYNSSCSQGGWLTPSSVSQEDTFVPNLFLLCSCSAQEQVTRQRFEFLWTNFTEFIRQRAHIHYSISFLGAQGRVTPKGCRTTSFSTGPSSLTLNWVMAPEGLCAQRYHLTGMRNWSITFSFFTE